MSDEFILRYIVNVTLRETRYIVLAEIYRIPSTRNQIKGTAHPSGAPEFTLWFLVGFVLLALWFSVWCFVDTGSCFYFFLLLLCCLSSIRGF